MSKLTQSKPNLAQSTASLNLERPRNGSSSPPSKTALADHHPCPGSRGCTAFCINSQWEGVWDITPLLFAHTGLRSPVALRIPSNAISHLIRGMHTQMSHLMFRSSTSQGATGTTGPEVPTSSTSTLECPATHCGEGCRVLAALQLPSAGSGSGQAAAHTSPAHTAGMLGSLWFSKFGQSLCQVWAHL